MAYKIEWYGDQIREEARKKRGALNVDPRTYLNYVRYIDFVDFERVSTAESQIAVKITGPITDEELQNVLQLARIRYGLVG